MYQDSIPTEDLPRKYTDAIQAAQQLGFQYLWIQPWAWNTFVLKGSFDGLVTSTVDDHKVHQFAEGAKYYAVPLLTEIEPGNGTFFLVLESLTPTWGLYRRVGLCHMGFDTGSYDDSEDNKDNEDNEGSKSDGSGDMPAICQDGLLLGAPLEQCRALACMIRASQEADVPAYESTADGRCLIIII